jgi:hypothetical protein
MNNELESQWNEITLFQFLAMFQRGYGGGKNKGKPQETLVKTVGFMTDVELLKVWINTT